MVRVRPDASSIWSAATSDVHATAGTNRATSLSLAAFEDVDVAGSTTDALILRAFMAIGTSRERLEFLG